MILQLFTLYIVRVCGIYQSYDITGDPVKTSSYYGFTKPRDHPSVPSTSFTAREMMQQQADVGSDVNTAFITNIYIYIYIYIYIKC